MIKVPQNASREGVENAFRKAAAHCSREVVVVNTEPADRGRAALRLLSPMVRMAQRGLRVRVLYQHAARSDLVVLTAVEKLTAVGAQVRTTVEAFASVSLFDLEIAVLRAPAIGESGGTHSPVVDPSVVAHLCNVYDRVWQSADPWDGHARRDFRTPDQLGIAILVMLAEGSTDEAVARRLGISPRTCRRHLAAAMKELGAESRFQAGVLATRVEWIS